jgi:hypothetical protein
MQLQEVQFSCLQIHHLVLVYQQQPLNLSSSFHAAASLLLVRYAALLHIRNALSSLAGERRATQEE